MLPSKAGADRGVEALPASPASVAAFLAAMTERGLRPATIARRCAAVRHYRRFAGADPLPTDAAIVKTNMKGLRRSLGAAAAKKAPATATIAKRMTDAMPDDSLKGHRDRAMVMLGFTGALRKSGIMRSQSPPKPRPPRVDRVKEDGELPVDVVMLRKGDVVAALAVTAEEQLVVLKIDHRASLSSMMARI